MAAGDKTPGRRMRDGTPQHELQPGEYCIDPGGSVALKTPNGFTGHVHDGADHGAGHWKVTIHPPVANDPLDPLGLGTITVAPSISIGEHRRNPDPKLPDIRHHLYHGFLEAGVWREA